MKPRVFISSTYYDLKYVRESLERFVKNYDFEPILFESGNVLFEPNKKIDASCYNEVSICHMMVLIIGGRYGSLASGDERDEKQKEYDKNVVSITQKEYLTATEGGIPVFVFIDKNVYGEYQTYSKNRTAIESGKLSMEYAFVDSPNVFKFIDKVSGTPIKTFERIEEIELYLKQQISAMFYQYLDNLQNKAKDSKVLDAVSEIKGVSERMNVMVQELGKHILNKSSGSEYESVIDKQNKILIDYFANYVCGKMEYQYEVVLSAEDCKFIAEQIYEICLTNPEWSTVQNDWSQMYNLGLELSNKIQSVVKSKYPKITNIKIDGQNAYGKFRETILPLLSNDPALKDYLITRLAKEIDSLYLPF